MTMDSEWVGFALTAVAVTVSLATFIRGGFARIEKRLSKLEDLLVQEAKARRQADARLEAAIGAMAKDLAQLAARTSRLEDRLGRIEVRFDGIESRFDRLEDRFEELEKRLGRLEVRFEELENRLGRIEVRFDGLESRFDRLEVRFDGIEDRLDRTEVRFDGLEDRLQVRFGGLEDRLEVRFGGLEVRLDRSASELSEAYARIESTFARHADKLADTAERTARIEGILVRYFVPTIQASAAQAPPLEASEDP